MHAREETLSAARNKGVLYDHTSAEHQSTPYAYRGRHGMNMLDAAEMRSSYAVQQDWGRELGYTVLVRVEFKECVSHLF